MQQTTALKTYTNYTDYGFFGVLQGCGASLVSSNLYIGELHRENIKIKQDIKVSRLINNKYNKCADNVAILLVNTVKDIQILSNQIIYVMLRGVNSQQTKAMIFDYNKKTRSTVTGNGKVIEVVGSIQYLGCC